MVPVEEASEGLVSHALDYNCVRGVTFQPVQDAGRNLGFDKNRDRVLLSDIRRGLIEQDCGFAAADALRRVDPGLDQGEALLRVRTLRPDLRLAAAEVIGLHA